MPDAGLSTGIINYVAHWVKRDSRTDIEPLGATVLTPSCEAVQTYIRHVRLDHDTASRLRSEVGDALYLISSRLRKFCWVNSVNLADAVTGKSSRTNNKLLRTRRRGDWNDYRHQLLQGHHGFAKSAGLSSSFWWVISLERRQLVFFIKQGVLDDWIRPLSGAWSVIRLVSCALNIKSDNTDK